MHLKVVLRVLGALYAFVQIGGVGGAVEGWSNVLQPLGKDPGRVVGVLILLAVIASLVPAKHWRAGWKWVKRRLHIQTGAADARRGNPDGAQDRGDRIQHTGETPSHELGVECNLLALDLRAFLAGRPTERDWSQADTGIRLLQAGDEPVPDALAAIREAAWKTPGLYEAAFAARVYAVVHALRERGDFTQDEARDLIHPRNRDGMMRVVNRLQAMANRLGG